MKLVVATSERRLKVESLSLLLWVVLLGVGVGKLRTLDKELKPLSQEVANLRMHDGRRLSLRPALRMGLCQRRHDEGMVHYKAGCLAARLDFTFYQAIKFLFKVLFWIYF